jgi:hypothetical protein
MFDTHFGFPKSPGYFQRRRDRNITSKREQCSEKFSIERPKMAPRALGDVSVAVQDFRADSDITNDVKDVRVFTVDLMRGDSAENIEERLIV